MFILIALTFNEIEAQTISILSEKHITKIEQVGSARKKIKLYKRFYSKDSARFAKQWDRYLEYQSDSIYVAHHNQSKAMAKASAERQLGKANLLPAIRQLEALDNPDSLLILKANETSDKYLPGQKIKLDSAQMNELEHKQLAGSELNEVGKLISQENEYRDRIRKLSKRDSLAHAELRTKAKAMARRRVRNSRQIKMLDEPRKSMEKLSASRLPSSGMDSVAMDTTFLKKQAKKKAEEAALKYMSENPVIMRASQTRMAQLINKYSVVPNSADLSTAEKRASLEGKSIRERIFISGNFRVANLKPVAIEASPAIGLRLTSRWISGVGINYSRIFNDTLSSAEATTIGYKSFLSYDVFGSFFASAEYSINTATGTRSFESGPSNWNSAMLVGVGRKISLHPRVDMTATLFYNVLKNPERSSTYSRWSFRVGFQTSALAFVKRKLQLTR